MQAKSSKNSEVDLVQLVLPIHLNSMGNMHGGEVVKLMDTAAGIAACRHANSVVVTASIDRLIFKEPIYKGNLIHCFAEVIYTGRTSIGVYVNVTLENLANGERKHALEGNFVLVALDKDGKPTKVPPLLIESDEQRERFEELRLRAKR